MPSLLSHHFNEAVFVLEIVGGALSSVGLYYFFEFDNTPFFSKWILILLWLAVLFSILIGISLLVSSAAKVPRGLRIAMGLASMEFVLLVISLIAFIKLYLDTIAKLHYCDTPQEIGLGTCVTVLSNSFCGTQITLQCHRAYFGMAFLVSGLGVLILSQIGAIGSAWLRKSVVTKELQLGYGMLVGS